MRIKNWWQTKIEKDRTIRKVPGEDVRVHGGGHEHELEVGRARQRVAQRDQQEVAELVALVHLVHEHVRHACKLSYSFGSIAKAIRKLHIVRTIRCSDENPNTELYVRFQVPWWKINKSRL